MKPSHRAIAFVAILLGSVIFLWLGTMLQRTTKVMFTSPDETAVAQYARTWSIVDGFRLPHGLPGDLADLAGLHPRSIVRQAESLVPVGFLGMPIAIGLVEKIAGGFGAYATPILTLSSVIPLYFLVRRRSRRIAVLTVLFYLFFPVVLLYANRGFFPNLPVVALALWSIWAWRRIGCACQDDDGIKKKFGIWSRLTQWNLVALNAMEFGIFLIAGLSTGLALIIRPIEALWIIPWVIWAWTDQGGGVKEDGGVGRPRHRLPMSMFIAGVVMISILAMGWIVARQTYGASHGLFPVGYLIHDDVGTGISTAMASAPSGSSGLLSFLPFGIHPRTLWANVRAYIGTAFGLWFGLAMAGIVIDLRRRKFFDRGTMVFYGLAVWTIAVLFLLYGQSAYMDNISGGVTIGNSFLRYLLPLTPLVALGCAMAVDRLFELPRRRGIIVAPIAAFILIILGIVTALARDNEGILRTRYELLRYLSIRTAVEQMIPAESIILSERSDKIFASGPFVAVSPIPDTATLDRLRESGRTSYYFTRTFDTEADSNPVVAAFGSVRPIFTLQNETMYLLQGENSIALNATQFHRVQRDPIPSR